MKSGTYHVDLSLPTEAEQLPLITAEGIEFATMNYKRQRAGVSEGLLPDGSDKRTKFTRGATPGAPNIVPDFDGPRLNELLAFNRSGAGDWVKFTMPRISRCRSMACALLVRRTAPVGRFPPGLAWPRAATSWYCATATVSEFRNTGFRSRQRAGDFSSSTPTASWRTRLSTVSRLPTKRSAKAPANGGAQRTDSRCGERDRCIVWRSAGLLINEWMASWPPGLIGLNCSTRPIPP